MLDTNTGAGIVVQGKEKEDPKMKVTDVAVTENLDLIQEEDSQNAGIGISKDMGIELPAKPSMVLPEEMQDDQNTNISVPEGVESEVGNLDSNSSIISDDTVEENTEEGEREEDSVYESEALQVEEKEEELKEDAVSE